MLRTRLAGTTSRLWQRINTGNILARGLIMSRSLFSAGPRALVFIPQKKSHKLRQSVRAQSQNSIDIEAASEEKRQKMNYIVAWWYLYAVAGFIFNGVLSGIMHVQNWRSTRDLPRFTLRDWLFVQIFWPFIIVKLAFG